MTGSLVVNNRLVHVGQRHRNSLCEATLCTSLRKMWPSERKKGSERNILKRNNAFLSTSLCLGFFGRLAHLWSAASTIKLESQRTVSFGTVAHDPFARFRARALFIQGQCWTLATYNCVIFVAKVFSFVCVWCRHIFLSNTHRSHAISVGFLESKMVEGWSFSHLIPLCVALRIGLKSPSAVWFHCSHWHLPTCCTCTVPPGSQQDVSPLMSNIQSARTTRIHFSCFVLLTINNIIISVCLCPSDAAKPYETHKENSLASV